MPLRLVSLLFIFLTIGFFWQIHWQKSLKSPDFLDSVFYAPEKENSIALNEFLILMEKGAENKLPLVLDKFNLTLVEPLGEWVHVASRDAAKEQKIGRLDSLGAQENQKILLALEANSFVHSAQLNHIQSDDGGCRACTFVSSYASNLQPGNVRSQLRAAFCVECGGGKFFVDRDRVDGLSPDEAIAPGQVWQPVAGQAGSRFCACWVCPRCFDLRGFLPVCVALH